jgi:hypothetical protein
LTPEDFMPTDEVVDVGETSLDLRRRELLKRVAAPISVVALIVITIFAIAFYAQEANRSGVLLLSDNVLATLEQQINQEVSAYLYPAIRATRLARDTTTRYDITDPLLVLQAFAASALRQIPQIDAFYSGDAKGDFVMVQRGPAGGTRAKLIQNAQGARRVEWVSYDADGRVVGREQVSEDDYDPRNRDWYQGAQNSDDVYWTDVYVFYTHREPGITASVRYSDASGEVRVFGVDITLKVLSDFLVSLHIGTSGRAVIVDEGGHVIAAPYNSKLLHEQDGQLATERVDDLGDPILTAAYDRYRVCAVKGGAFQWV